MRRHAGDDDGASSHAELTSIVEYLGYTPRRLRDVLAFVVGALVVGGFGYLAAPFIGQPREAGFWDGAAIFFVVLVPATVVAIVGYERGSPRFRWMERLYSYVA